MTQYLFLRKMLGGRLKPSVNKTLRAVYLVFIATLVGCYETDYPYLAMGNSVPPTDEKAFSLEWRIYHGQQRFLWDTWGVEQQNTWPPAEFMLALMEDEPEVFGNQFASFGFIPDPNDEFPIGFKRGSVDDTKVHETCALCHVQKLSDEQGTLWLGAPAVELDFSRFRYEVNERWVAAGNPSKLSEMEIAKSLIPGPGRTFAEIPAYPTAIPANFPVYFDLGDRNHLNYLGTGTETKVEAALALYTMGAGKKGGVPFPSDFVVNGQLVKFLDTLKAPAAPIQDAELVSQGEAVFFAAQCDTCHHIDDVGDDFIVTREEGDGCVERIPGMDAAFPRGSICTSELHRALIDEAGLSPDGFLPMIVFVVSKFLIVRPNSDGYRTSNLHGLWLSAPYLHNGSVPTLEDLLSPALERTVEFSVNGFVVDTNAPGNSNEGHEFGTELSAEDKTALIAFLNSL